MESNTKYYKEFLENKFEYSHDKYKIILEKNNDVYDFLKLYEGMNVFPVYPTPIILPIKKDGDNCNIEILKTNNFNTDISLMKSTNELLNNKINEYHSIYKNKNISFDKVRRYFDYELRDKVTNIMKNTYITNAWVKMYELLKTFDLFKDLKEINTFHICEHPGAFIYACQDYIKINNSDAEHNFIFQSLNPATGKHKRIFKTEGKLLSKYGDKLDYGPKNTGDITDIDNILYYRKKYGNNKYNLITSDCGLDCSSDFGQQEGTLVKIFFGAFLCAIGISNKGSNYIFKMFSYMEKKSIELLGLCCLFYESVDVVRTLSTKGGSGEIYVMCKNFIKLNDFDIKFRILIDYYKNYNENEFVLKTINKSIISNIIKSNYVLSIRRVISINQLIFRHNNMDFVNNNKETISYVQRMVKYYVDYYMQYTKLDKIE